MALSETDGNMVMPVSPMVSGNGNGFGGDWSGWLILFLIFGMFGNGGWGNGYGGMNAQLGYDFPWLMNGQNGINANTNAGFAQAATQSAIAGLQNAVTSGFGDVATQLCGGFAGVNAGVSNGFAQAEISNNARQIANMQQSFANQTAMTQGFNNIQSQFADCCCENRLSSCQTQNIIQNEGNATRFADANNTRDIIQSQSNGTQAILDKLCQLELTGKNDRIADLERQLTMANLAASQNAQTAAILANNEAQTTALEQYLAPVPRPAFIVQNPNCCSQNYGCGIG